MEIGLLKEAAKKLGKLDRNHKNTGHISNSALKKEFGKQVTLTGCFKVGSAYRKLDQKAT